MIKRVILGMFAVAGLLATSCSSDDDRFVIAPEDAAQVTFDINLEGATETRAISDGSNVNKLVYAVYSKGEEISELGGESVVSGKKASLSLTLAKNQDYTVLFWAQNGECGAYNTDNLKAVTVDYSKFTNNNDALDAFHGKSEIKVAGNENKAVTLTRPFAQVNVGVTTEDWNAATASGLTITKSKVVINEVATIINLMDSTVSEYKEVTYPLNTIPGEDLTVDANNYKHLSMSYVLVGKEKSTVNLAYTFAPEDGNGNEITFADGLSNVPVQRNYRTNIVGTILTGTFNYSVTIDAEFGGENNLVEEKTYATVKNDEELLQWLYIAKNEDLEYGLKLIGNITMKNFTIEEDAVNKTYIYTSTPITVTDGVPSGSNFIPAGTGISGLSDAYSGHIDGNGHTITGLRIVLNNDQVGFVGCIHDSASIKNITLDDAVIKGNSEVGVVCGRSQNGTIIENVHVKNSTVTGSNSVGGIAGRNYRRLKAGTHNEKMAYVKNCTSDENTKVICSGSNAGGIVGYNYGATIINCVNNADVTGVSDVGGIVGYTREYYTKASGYVIANYSTDKATIKATNGNAGGIVGNSLFDDANHDDADSYIVGCYSLSEVSAKNLGALIGKSQNTTLRGCYGSLNGSTKISGSGTPTIYGTYAFANAAAVTNSEVTEMNAAIDTYNGIVGIEVVCDYKWDWTSGNWPTLKTAP